MNIKKNLHVYILVLTIATVITNLSYHYLYGNGIITSNTRYNVSIEENKEINFMAELITSKCSNKNDQICQVQSLLDYVTNIPYKINENQAKKPSKTIENNYGDCDDKSSLLISLLNSKKYKAYFVLIPKHIYVIVKIKDDKRLNGKPFYKINNEKFYILESTIPDSKIGYQAKHDISKIEEIVEPFEKKIIDLDIVKYYN